MCIHLYGVPIFPLLWSQTRALTWADMGNWMWFDVRGTGTARGCSRGLGLVPVGLVPGPGLGMWLRAKAEAGAAAAAGPGGHLLFGGAVRLLSQLWPWPGSVVSVPTGELGTLAPPAEGPGGLVDATKAGGADAGVATLML